MRCRIVLAAGFLAFAAGASSAGEEECPDECIPFDVDARPLTVPQPVFPVFAAYLGLGGYCEVRFSVTPDGRTTAIEPACSRPAFCDSAARAIGEMRFKPAERGGKRVLRSNVVAPLTFLLDGMDQAVVEAQPLRGCVDPNIS
ncbi:energy transducer TonB [Hyphomonas sp.]|uniref:energy transducer TonB n=1 Tax=Hyphomonas sp. TaxID=87 RepID=UPI00391BA6D1